MKYVALAYYYLSICDLVGISFPNGLCSLRPAAIDVISLMLPLPVAQSPGTSRFQAVAI